MSRPFRRTSSDDGGDDDNEEQQKSTGWTLRRAAPYIGVAAVVLAAAGVYFYLSYSESKKKKQEQKKKRDEMREGENEGDGDGEGDEGEEDHGRAAAVQLAAMEQYKRHQQALAEQQQQQQQQAAAAPIVDWEHTRVMEQIGAHLNPVTQLHATMQYFGVPDGLVTTRGGWAHWNGDTLRTRQQLRVPWTSVTIKDELVKTEKPTLQYDFCYVEMPVPPLSPQQLASVQAVSPSLQYDGHTRQLRARSNSVDNCAMLLAAAARAIVGEQYYETPDAITRRFEDGLTRTERRLLSGAADPAKVVVEDMEFLNEFVADTISQQQEQARDAARQAAPRRQAYAPANTTMDTSLAVLSGTNTLPQVATVPLQPAAASSPTA